MTAQELKNSILQRAIEGRLVEQRAEEGSGEELLAKIFDEVDTFANINNIKNNNKHIKIEENELDFDLPENWGKVRLGEICFLLNGKKENKGSYPYLEVKYLRGNIEPKIKTSGRIVNKDTNIILMDGENSGEVFKTKEMGYLGSTLKILYFPKLLNEKLYLYFLLLNKKYLRDNKRGVAIPHLDKEVFFNLIFPVPPLAEQKRIVEKLEKLMPLLERYDESWQRLEDLDKRFPETLKKSLLQEAIKGRLVEQKAEEGTGEALYKLIQKEKKKLIKIGTLKKQKALPEIKEDEIPFEIPKTWKWVRLGDVIDLISGQDFPPSKYSEKEIGIPYITGASNIQDEKVIINRWTEFGSKIANKGDLLITCKGTIGKVAVIEVDKAHIARQIMGVKPYNGIEKGYIKFYLNNLSNSLINSAKSIIPGITRNDILFSVLPLPPLNEQKRIVEKLEELMPLCEQLTRKTK